MFYFLSKKVFYRSSFTVTIRDCHGLFITKYRMLVNRYIFDIIVWIFTMINTLFCQNQYLTLSRMGCFSPSKGRKWNSTVEFSNIQNIWIVETGIWLMVNISYSKWLVMLDLWVLFCTWYDIASDEPTYKCHENKCINAWLKHAKYDFNGRLRKLECNFWTTYHKKWLVLYFISSCFVL